MSEEKISRLVDLMIHMNGMQTETQSRNHELLRMAIESLSDIVSRLVALESRCEALESRIAERGSP